MWSDGPGRTRAARRPIRGRSKAARLLAALYGPHRALAFEPIEVNAQPAVVLRAGCTRQLLALAVSDHITDVYLISNPDKLRLVT